MYMYAHMGEQVHAYTCLHASNIECFPWVPGSELRTSCTLLIDHLQAPQISVPARPSNEEPFQLVSGIPKAPEPAEAASSHMWPGVHRTRGQEVFLGLHPTLD